MADDPTTKTLTELGVSGAEDVARQFDQVLGVFDQETSVPADEGRWEGLRNAWLGRKSGVLTRITENWLKTATPTLRPAVGRCLNELRAHVEQRLGELQKAAESAAEQAALARERVDLSLPGVVRPIGSRHLLRQTFAEIERIFLSLGFTVVEGPEIETPYYNFEALNIPEHHPARDTMDTFYLETPAGAPQRLLRTHTSPMQVRTMEKQAPPVRIIVPGKVYRRDNPDATHSYVFHQVEGLAVDTDITFCEFKGTVEYFVRGFWARRRRRGCGRAIPFHRTLGGDRRDLLCVRWKRLPPVQIFRMDRAVRGGNGGPSGVRLCELRRQAIVRLCFWAGRGPALAAQIVGRRCATLLSERSALPAVVFLSVREMPGSSLQLACGIRGHDAAARRAAGAALAHWHCRGRPGGDAGRAAARRRATINRPDLLGHYGMAREVAAIERRRLRASKRFRPSSRAHRECDARRYRMPELCGRYTARVLRGVKVGPAREPLWRRLEALGQASINNVVDATNYVMLELGHPMHAFDLDRLAERRIVVRRARAGEKMRTLDGLEARFAGDVCDCDAARGVAIGGIMGGAESETHAGRGMSCWNRHGRSDFHLAHVEGAGLAHGASLRFERGAIRKWPNWRRCGARR